MEVSTEQVSTRQKRINQERISKSPHRSRTSMFLLLKWMLDGLSFASRQQLMLYQGKLLKCRNNKNKIPSIFSMSSIVLTKCQQWLKSWWFYRLTCVQHFVHKYPITALCPNPDSNYCETDRLPICLQSVEKTTSRRSYVEGTYLIEVEDTARCVINRRCRHVAVREKRWVVGTVVCHCDHCWLSVPRFEEFQKSFSPWVRSEMIRNSFHFVSHQSRLLLFVEWGLFLKLPWVREYEFQVQKFRFSVFLKFLLF